MIDSAARPRQFFYALEGIRGLAAVLIMEYHVVLYFSFDAPSSFLRNHLYLLVDFFFMLSGFLTAHTSDGEMARGVPLSSYLARRLVRLYPMVLVGVLLGAIPLIAARHAFPDLAWSSIATAILSGLLLLPTTALTSIKPYVFPVNSPLWTVSAEVLFCAAYAATFDWTRRRLPTLTILAAAVLVLTSFSAGGLNVGYRYTDYALGFGRLAFPFLMGMLLRRSHLFRPETLRAGYWSALFLIVAVINPINVSWWYDALVDLCVLPPILLLAANAKRAVRWDGPAKNLGSLAYPLYAVHFPFVVAMANASKMLHLGPRSSLLAALACSLLAGGTAVLAAKFDRSARRLLAGLMKPQGTPESLGIEMHGQLELGPKSRR